MNSDIITISPAVVPANSLDDDIFALTLQLEELTGGDSCDTGKYREGEPPDATLALKEYQIEVAMCLGILTDLKLARSIAHAVAIDGPIISNLVDMENQAQDDRRAALQASIDDPELESPATPPPCEDIGLAQSLMLTKEHYNKDLQWDTISDLGDDWNFQASDNECDGERSSWMGSNLLTYTRHQETAFKTFGSPGITCCVCSERFRPGDVLRLECNDVFCRTCLREFIMTTIQDKSLFPPKCHNRALSRKVVSCLLSEEELENFESTEVEVSSGVKTYCSNVSCGRFIPPAQIIADRADCIRCGSSTCTNCKGEFHENDCPEDPLLQLTLKLADDQKWQRCFQCGAIVDLTKACNHIK